MLIFTSERFLKMTSLFQKCYVETMVIPFEIHLESFTVAETLYLGNFTRVVL